MLLFCFIITPVELQRHLAAFHCGRHLRKNLVQLKKGNVLQLGGWMTPSFLVRI